MQTYLILKEKAKRWNADKEIQALIQEINQDDGAMKDFQGAYDPKKAARLKSINFDRAALGGRGLQYERLDQLTIEVLLGVR